MLDKLESILRDECRLEKTRPILAGVSGGPDSLCLLAMLHEAGWQVIAAHFNHQLRPEAVEEAAAVEALARQMGIPFIGGSGDVRAHAAEAKLSIEAAARELRYRFLFEQARRHHAQAVAVGHTADDQVETVLMHFVRGAGLNGLKGMAYRLFLEHYAGDIPLVRPLLDFWRSDTVAYCELHGLEPQYDASNDSVDFLRNRLRHELIPALETYNPRVREAIWRSGKTLALDHELLAAALEPAWQGALVRQTDAYVSLDGDELLAQPRSVQMHLLRRAAQHLLPDTEVEFEALQRGAEFIADSARQRVDLIGGLFVLREENRLYVTADESALPRDQWPQMNAGADAVRFSTPFDFTLALGWRFSASACSRADAGLGKPWSEADPFEAWLDAQAVHEPLELRVRREGDRFEPLGMEGHSQKLSDFFVNAKLPARARDRWPIVCAGEEVVWVPGYRPAHKARVQSDTTQLLHMVLFRP